jgi:hypothetical protein
MPESENEIPEEHKIIDRFKRKSKRLKNAALVYNSFAYECFINAILYIISEYNQGDIGMNDAEKLYSVLETSWKKAFTLEPYLTRQREYFFQALKKIEEIKERQKGLTKR